MLSKLNDVLGSFYSIFPKIHRSLDTFAGRVAQSFDKYPNLALPFGILVFVVFLCVAGVCIFLGPVVFMLIVPMASLLTSYILGNLINRFLL